MLVVVWEYLYSLGHGYTANKNQYKCHQPGHIGYDRARDHRIIKVGMHFKHLVHDCCVEMTRHITAGIVNFIRMVKRFHCSCLSRHTDNAGEKRVSNDCSNAVEHFEQSQTYMQCYTN